MQFLSLIAFGLALWAFLHWLIESHRHYARKIGAEFARALAPVSRRVSSPVRTSEDDTVLVNFAHQRDGLVATIEASIHTSPRKHEKLVTVRGAVTLDRFAGQLVAGPVSPFTGIGQFVGLTAQPTGIESFDRLLVLESEATPLAAPVRAALSRIYTDAPESDEHAFSIEGRAVQFECRWNPGDPEEFARAVVPWLDDALTRIVRAFAAEPREKPQPVEVAAPRPAPVLAEQPAVAAPAARKPLVLPMAEVAEGHTIEHAVPCAACTITVRFDAVQCKRCGQMMHADCLEERPSCGSHRRAA